MVYHISNYFYLNWSTSGDYTRRKSCETL